MASSPRVFVVGTFDTKACELGYIAQCLRDAGVAACTVDVSTLPGERVVDVGCARIAAAHPHGAAAVFTGDRGSAVTGMADALTAFLLKRTDVAGVIGAGGSGATALVTPAMQALPIGLPKIMVSTLA